MDGFRILVERALARHRDGARDEAAALYARALAVAPAHAGLLGNRGTVLESAGRPAEAAAAYVRAARCAPDSPAPWFNLGNARRALGDDSGAAAAFARALTLGPDHAGALLNLGDRLLAAGRPEEAERWLARADAVQPGTAATLYRLGRARQRRGRVRDAVAPLHAALAAQPGLLAAMEALAECLHLAGDRAAGAAWFHRYQGADTAWLAKLRVPGPVAPLPPGGRVLLVADSGFGDTLQFLCYAPWLAARGHRVFVECQPALLPVAVRAGGVTAAIPTGAERPAVDAVVPLHSLPHLVDAAPEELAAALPCLSADPARAAEWRRRLDAVADGALKVGLVWAGTPDGATNQGRTPGLAPLLPLAALPGVTLVGLQLGPGRRDLESAPLPAAFTDLGPEIADFGDTAAILAGLDVLVTSDTAAAHLAGGMGVPVRVLLPFVPAWRWGLTGETTPWYPSARLHRQPAPGDWATPVAVVAAALRRTVAERGGRT
ncbi:tetratricopeptide repeat protein [Azospirillum halopraeferens]|uniref:tetratricopeptide repeat-containing glycosyltransferase family protein n=1 Tax=Azospirillum halopraeferens TaxID=34010 RepID=UPI0003FCBE85|nr:tetratricopeptide repeat-containing glycosyltransferase family protein [Azospirillum halopraeferens]